MAKLSAHGQEIARFKFTTYSKAIMSDGAVLKNYGDGWKLAGKIKSGVTPEQASENQRKACDAFADSHPCMMAYRKELHSLAGMGKAWKINAAIELMYDDPDGVWSEACDGYGDNVHADIDEVSHLCSLYVAALEEARELRDPTNALG